MNKKITIIVALVFIMGLVGFTGVNAATYNQPLYSTTQSTDMLDDAANQHNGGQVYYVDGNRINNDGDGTSWATAYSLLSTAMAASHANIGLASNRAWAARNTIYVRGDEITEDFIKLAQKTDIIGVGSNDAYGKAGVTGSWIIPDTVNYMGCHFYNVMFTDAGATALFDIDSQTGLEFHGCLFDSGTATTIGLQIEESGWLIVDNCEFSRVHASLGFATAAISVVDDTDAFYGARISNNRINTAGIGIDWNETESYNCIISDNTIYATGLVIDCESDDVTVVRNMLMTAVDCDTYAIGTGFDFDLKNAAGNILMGSGGGAIANEVPPLE